jgi:hypothetical protein
MFALKRSVLNGEQILINVLKALASVISMCSLHVILVSNIYLLPYLLMELRPS